MKDKLPIERDILNWVRSGQVRIPSISVSIDTKQGSANQRVGSKQEPDAIATIRWRDGEERFVVECKARSTPQEFQSAISNANRYAKELQLRPLLLLPYLSETQLQSLAELEASGIDLCGNAIIVVPGKLFIMKTGEKNRFKDSYLIKDVYRGNSSLVARSLLVMTKSRSLADLESFIASRGGKLTLTTISKALRRLQDDLIIEKRKGAAVLLQPEELLQKMAESYKEPRVTQTLVGKSGLSLQTMAKKLAGANVQFAISGASSIDRYGVMGREEMVTLYCESLLRAVEAVGEVTETERFPDIELKETTDQTLYFDLRSDKGVPYASPIQSFLELANGDKREKDASRQVLRYILDELNNTMRVVEESDDA